jgi:hypothetical protein
LNQELRALLVCAIGVITCPVFPCPYSVPSKERFFVSPEQRAKAVADASHERGSIQSSRNRERGADASLTDDMGMTAVQAASRNGHVGVAKILRGHTLKKIKLTGSRGKNGKP